MRDVVDRATRDARALQAGGCDAIIVENMGDVPYVRGPNPPEAVAAATVATAAVTRAVDLPVGVQLLAGANRQALGIAIAAGCAFIRVEAFAYAHVADEGLLQASAAELTRTRAALGVDVAIYADVAKKHAAHALTADLSLADLCHGHVFCGADALIITGRHTGQPPEVADLEVARAAGVPVVVGSGTTPANAAALAAVADAVIVGSALKVDGDWRREVELDRVRALAAALPR